MTNGWKIAFWILFVILILENIVIGYVFKMGIDMVNNEIECQVNVCSGYDAFIYDNYAQMCYCYKDNEIVVQKYLGG